MAQVEDGLAKLQSLDQSTYTRQANGDAEGAGAIDAAQKGQRARIVAKVFDHWQRAPSFFRREELDILAHHLILLARTKDALKVVQSLLPGARTPFERADLLLKMGRLHAAEGDAFDLEKARSHLTAAAAASEDIKARGTRNSAKTNISYYRVFMELQNEQVCAYITPHIQELASLSAAGTQAESGLDTEIVRLKDVYDGRCAGG